MDILFSPKQLVELKNDYDLFVHAANKEITCGKNGFMKCKLSLNFEIGEKYFQKVFATDFNSDYLVVSGANDSVAKIDADGLSVSLQFDGKDYDFHFPKQDFFKFDYGKWSTSVFENGFTLWFDDHNWPSTLEMDASEKDTESKQTATCSVVNCSFIKNGAVPKNRDFSKEFR